MQDKEICIYGDGRQVRDVLAVQDLVRAFEAVHERQEATAGQIYNVGGGRDHTISLLELIERIEKLLHKRVSYRFHEGRPGDQSIYVTNFTKLRQHVGWSPRISLQQTIENIHDWWRHNRQLFAPATFSRNAGKSMVEILPGVAS